MSSTQDVRFNESKIAEGRQLANKLFNASRLVLLRVPGDVTVPPVAPEPKTVEDRWILSRLQAAEQEITEAFDTFEFHRATQRLYGFIYAELCDWYLEMLKPRLYAEDNREATEFALYVLAQTLAIAHPVIPFVTEEIWSYIPGADGLLMAHRWPHANDELRDLEVEAEVERAIEATERLRGWRDQVRAAPGTSVPARLEAEGYERVLEHIARLARFEFSGDGDPTHPLVATVGVPGGRVAVLPSSGVDLEAEKQRAAERAATLRKEIARAEGKLANQGFVAKAPEAVVQAERDKLARLKSELEELEG
jgi:valyl-tRNA synthetase